MSAEFMDLLSIKERKTKRERGYTTRVMPSRNLARVASPCAMMTVEWRSDI